MAPSALVSIGSLSCKECGNKTLMAVTRLTKSLYSQKKITDNFDAQTQIAKDSTAHTYGNCKDGMEIGNGIKCPRALTAKPIQIMFKVSQVSATGKVVKSLYPNGHFDLLKPEILLRKLCKFNYLTFIVLSLLHSMAYHSFLIFFYHINYENIY